VKNIEEIPEKYKKNLGFIEMMIADCEAWVKYYSRAIDDLQEKIDSSQSIVDDFQECLGRPSSKQDDYYVLKQRFDEVVEIQKDKQGCIDDLLYWKLMVNKWKGEYAVEKEKQEKAQENSI
jgi:hypothetical protein